MGWLETLIEHNYVLVQSSSAQSGIPLLRKLIIDYATRTPVLLILLQYSPSSFVDDVHGARNLTILDLNENVPGYSTEYVDPQNAIMSQVNAFPAGKLTVVLDAIHTLLLDLGSPAKTSSFLRRLYKLLHLRSANLVLHGLAPCPALLQVIPTTFSPSLLHFVSHPTALILRIAQEYLTLPPPASDPAKFWSLFQSIGSRVEESEKTVYGSTGSGSGDLAEFVVEATIRYAGVSSRKRTLERELYGFLESLNGICDINLLPGLQTLFKSIPTIEQQVSHEQGPSTSFNLNLTDSQQQARANVPLPYAHQNAQDVGGTIYYEYSDGDDYDADDPDEDLDI